MFQKYKKQLLLSSAATLLPVLVGLILWNTLPDRFATHWGFSGQADGWSGKAFAVFVPPLIMLASNWLCFFLTSLDPRAEQQHRKVFGMIFWVFPVLSLSTSGMMFALALGTEFNMTSILMPGMAIIFILIGNYMPKCRQNHTIGIKVPWTLANEENWNVTHRFAGKLWVAGGFAMFFLAFLPAEMAFVPMFALILILALVPMFYSWRYYKKQNRDGVVYEIHPSAMDEKTRKMAKYGWIFVTVILVIVAIILLTGRIDCTFEDTSFTVDSTFWTPLTVDYDNITEIELRESNVSGTRVWGFGSWKLLLGTFENKEFGVHTRYTYCNPESCIILTCGESILVLSGIDAEETAAIYETIAARVNS